MVFKMIAWYDKHDPKKDGEEEQKESSNNAELCAQKGAKKDAYSNNSKGAESVVKSVQNGELVIKVARLL